PGGTRLRRFGRRRLCAGRRTAQGSRRLRRCEPGRRAELHPRARSEVREWLVQDHYRRSVRVIVIVLDCRVGKIACCIVAAWAWRVHDFAHAERPSGAPLPTLQLHPVIALACAISLAAVIARFAHAAPGEDTLRSYRVVGDAIPDS